MIGHGGGGAGGGPVQPGMAARRAQSEGPMGRNRAWGIAPAAAQAGAAAAAGLPSSHMSSSTVISSPPPSNGAAIGAGASAGATAKSTLAVMTVGASNKNLVSIMMTIDGRERRI